MAITNGFSGYFYGINGGSGSGSSKREAHFLIGIGQSQVVNRDQASGITLTIPSNLSQLKRDGTIGPMPANGQLEFPLNSNVNTIDTLAGFSPLAQYAVRYATDNPGVDVIVMPEAAGDSGFSGAGSTNQWQENGTHLTKTLDRIAAVMSDSTLNSTYSEIVLAGVLWMQGEDDVPNPLYAQELRSFLTNLPRRIERRLGYRVRSFPITISGMTDAYLATSSGGTPTQKATTQGIILRSPTFCPYTAYVDGSGLASLGDNVHFTGASAQTMGDRHYNARATAMANTPRTRKGVMTHPDIEAWYCPGDIGDNSNRSGVAGGTLTATTGAGAVNIVDIMGTKAGAFPADSQARTVTGNSLLQLPTDWTMFARLAIIDELTGTADRMIFAQSSGISANSLRCFIKSATGQLALILAEGGTPSAVETSASGPLLNLGPGSGWNTVALTYVNSTKQLKAFVNGQLAVGLTRTIASSVAMTNQGSQFGNTSTTTGLGGFIADYVSFKTAFSDKDVYLFHEGWVA